MRDRRNLDAGVYVDSKLVANDANLSGIALGAYPQGFGSTTYPALTYALAAADGSTINLVENAPNTMRGPLPTPLNTMSLGRCSLLDASTEVFYNDHRFLGTTAVIGNQLVRYTINLSSPGSPLIEVWKQASAAWATVGNYQTQCYDGAAYTVLPLQGFQPLIVSPEEIVWEERRYDSAGKSLVRTVNRIRRGSLIVESQIVAASGLPLSGAQSVGLTNIGAGTAAATSMDGTAAIATANAVLPAFLYLTTPATAATVSTTNFYSGISVASGTVGRIGILCGIEDTSQWALFVAFAAPSAPTSVVPTGGAAQTWTYKLIRVNATYGTTSAQSTATSTAAGAATLDGTHYNTINFTAPPAGSTYQVVRTASGGTPASTGVIAVGITGTSFVDNGIVAPVSSSSTVSQDMAYATRWASINRMRVKQRLMP
jgi:hypothetical protein